MRKKFWKFPTKICLGFNHMNINFAHLLALVWAFITWQLFSVRQLLWCTQRHSFETKSPFLSWVIFREAQHAGKLAECVSIRLSVVLPTRNMSLQQVPKHGFRIVVNGSKQTLYPGSRPPGSKLPIWRFLTQNAIFIYVREVSGGAFASATGCCK